MAKTAIFHIGLVLSDIAKLPLPGHCPFLVEKASPNELTFSQLVPLTFPDRKWGAMVKKAARKAAQAHPAPPADASNVVMPDTAPKGRKVGRPSFRPSPEQKKIVEAAVGFGLKHVRICQLIINPSTGGPISTATLHEHFPAQLQKGKAMAHFNVGKSLYDQAVGIPKMSADGTKQIGWVVAPVPAATIWFTKSQMGWKDSSRGIDVSVFEAFVRDIGGNVSALRAIRYQLAPPDEPAS